MSPGGFPQEDLSADWGRRRGRARQTGWGGPDLYCQSRERDSDSEEGGEIKREKKPQSPLTPCLTPVIHWDTSFWPALIHDCSVQQLSTNQQAESPLTATRSAAIVCMGDKLSCLKSIVLICKTFLAAANFTKTTRMHHSTTMVFATYIINVENNWPLSKPLPFLIRGDIFSASCKKDLMYCKTNLCGHEWLLCLFQYTHTYLDMQIC